MNAPRLTMPQRAAAAPARNATRARVALLAAGATIALAPAAAGAQARANEYPTVDRVEFVVECMYRHEGKQELLYKCSCVIDAIARELKYDDYVAASLGSRYRDMGGERMGMFRDAPNVTADVKRYQAVLKKANEQCAMPEKGK
jgi:hypothetical protein